VVFDLVGGEIQTHLFQVLRHGGKLTERLSRIDAVMDCGELRTVAHQNQRARSSCV
jgi:hypothetical protein